MAGISNSPNESVSNRDYHDEYLNTILLDKKQWSYVKRLYGLTPRECQIAELICHGLQNGNIAEHLHIRPGTVKTHTRNIYRKIHVKSKIAMLLRFVADAQELYLQTDRPHSFHSAS